VVVGFAGAVAVAGGGAGGGAVGVVGDGAGGAAGVGVHGGIAR